MPVHIASASHADFFDRPSLRQRIIAPLITLFRLLNLQPLEMFTQREPNQLGPVQFGVFRSPVAGLQQFLIDHHLNGFRCRPHSIAAHGRRVVFEAYARILFTTLPATSVSRKFLPWNL